MLTLLKIAVVGLIAVTAVQLGVNVGRSVPALMPAAMIFAAALALLYLWRSKASIPVIILGCGAAGMTVFR